MSLLTALAFVSLAAEPVLVAPYQSLGVEPATVSAITEGFRQAVESPKLTALPATESEKVSRSATMCGEDGACLATVGTRSNARWVVAFGVGKVGASLLLTALFIDVKDGKEVTRSSRRVPEGMADWVLVTRSLAEEVVKPPAEPVVVQVPIEVVKPVKPHTFRPWTFVSLGIAAAFAVTATVLGLVAAGNYQRLQMQPNDDVIRGNQRPLNGSADGCLVVSVLTGAVSILFFILDAAEKPVVPTE